MQLKILPSVLLYEIVCNGTNMPIPANDHDDAFPLPLDVHHLPILVVLYRKLLPNPALTTPFKLCASEG